MSRRPTARSLARQLAALARDLLEVERLTSERAARDRRLVAVFHGCLVALEERAPWCDRRPLVERRHERARA